MPEETMEQTQVVGETTTDQTQVASETPAQEQEPQRYTGNPEIAKRFSAYADKLREKEAQIEELTRRLEELERTSSYAPETPEYDNTYPELKGLPTDADGNVYLNGHWMTPDYALQEIRWQRKFEDIDKKLNAILQERQQTELAQEQQQLVNTIADEIRSNRAKTFTGLPEDAGSVVDHLIEMATIQVVENQLQQGQEWTPELVMQSIPVGVDMVKNLVASLANVQIQNNVKAATEAPVPTGGSVAMPGQKNIWTLPERDRLKVLEDAAHKHMGV